MGSKKAIRFSVMLLCAAALLSSAAHAEQSTVTLTGKSDGGAVMIGFTEVGAGDPTAAAASLTSGTDPAIDATSTDVRNGLVAAGGLSGTIDAGATQTVTVKRVTSGGKPGYKASSTGDFVCWVKNGNAWMELEPGVDVTKKGITFRKTVPNLNISVHNAFPSDVSTSFSDGIFVDIEVGVDFDATPVSGLLSVAHDFEVDAQLIDTDVSFLDTSPLAAATFSCTGTPPNCSGTCPDVPEWTNEGCVPSLVTNACVWRYSKKISRPAPPGLDEGSVCSAIVDPDNSITETGPGAESDNQLDVVAGTGGHQIPTLSAWGFIVTLLLLTGVFVVISRRKQRAA